MQSNTNIGRTAEPLLPIGITDPEFKHNEKSRTKMLEARQEGSFTGRVSLMEVGTVKVIVG